MISKLQKNRSILFTPKKINKLEIKNRFIRSATNERMATEEGKITEQLINYYCKLAKGEIGLIVTGNAYTLKDGKSSPGTIAIYDDNYISNLRKLTKKVHAYGAKIAIQLNYAGARSPSSLIGKIPSAPSSVRNPLFGNVLPRSLKTDEIEGIISSFGAAAERAQEAGFDAVQILGAHGYLISQFLSPLTNKRTDEWGGSLSRRTRFAVRVYQNIRNAVGPDYPVFMKIGLADIEERGLNVSNGCQIVSLLSSMRMDAFEISCGITVKRESILTNILRENDEAYFLPFADAAKKITTYPLILVGGIRSVRVMVRLINSGVCDFIAMRRPFIKEPDLVNKIMMGKAEKAFCTSCNLYCIGTEATIKTTPIKCLQKKQIAPCTT